MSSYFEYNGERYNIPSDCSLSMGNTCETKERRMSDGTKSSYAIVTYRKPQYNTYSLSFALSHIEYPNLIAELYKWESLVGKPIQFTYCNIPFTSVIVSDMSVAIATDAALGIIGLNLSFNLRDNIVITRKAEVINTRLE